MLRRSKHLFDRDTLKTIYNTFVLPHFDYCSLVWNNCSKTLQNKLQKLRAVARGFELGGGGVEGEFAE